MTGPGTQEKFVKQMKCTKLGKSPPSEPFETYGGVGTLSDASAQPAVRRGHKGHLHGTLGRQRRSRSHTCAFQPCSPGQALVTHPRQHLPAPLSRPALSSDPWLDGVCSLRRDLRVSRRTPRGHQQGWRQQRLTQAPSFPVHASTTRGPAERWPPRFPAQLPALQTGNSTSEVKPCGPGAAEPAPTAA